MAGAERAVDGRRRRPRRSATLLPAFYLTYSLFKGAPAPANPWGAKGLEWTMPSPPPTFNFDEDPVVDEPAYNYKPGREVHVG